MAGYRTPFLDHLGGFVVELRSHGLSIAPSAQIDAARALQVLDLLDREAFREGLGCTLLDDHRQRAVFDSVFDLWFPLGGGSRSTTTKLPLSEAVAITDEPRVADIDRDAARNMIADIFADESSQGSVRRRDIVAQIVDRAGRYQSTRGEVFSAYQAISWVDPQTLIAKIAASMARADTDDADVNLGAQPRYRRAAANRAGELRAMIEAETQRRMAGVRGREHVAAHAVPTLPENIAFLAAGADQQRQLRTTITPLARLLATRLEVRRRRAHRGSIDIRRTLRQSMTTGGVPLALVRRRPRPGRPDLTILCDLSGSVAGFSQFTLHLAYALRQEFTRVRVFAFIDSVTDVTRYFEPADSGSDEFHTAMAAMLNDASLITRGGHSDYGRVLSAFLSDYGDTLTRRGALLILGDARTNYGDPRAAALAALVARARHAYWLNPEASALWDSGDSVASVYGEIIEMYECRTAGQLADVISSLLPV